MDESEESLIDSTPSPTGSLSRRNAGSLASQSAKIVSDPESMTDVALQTSKDIQTSTHNNANGRWTLVSCFKVVANLLSDTLHFKLFRIPTFIVFELAAGSLCAASAMTILYIVPHATEQGVSKSKASQLLTVCNVVDLFSRIVLGYLSDRGFVRKSTLIAMASLIMGVFTHLLRFYTNYSWLMFYVVIVGVFNGVYYSLWAAVIVDYLTVARLHSCLGFTTLCHGIALSASYAVLWYARDVSESYISPFHIIGGMQFIGALFMFVLPLVESAYNRHQSRTKARVTVDMSIDT